MVHCATLSFVHIPVSVLSVVAFYFVSKTGHCLPLTTELYEARNLCLLS